MTGAWDNRPGLRRAPSTAAVSRRHAETPFRPGHRCSGPGVKHSAHRVEQRGEPHEVFLAWAVPAAVTVRAEPEEQVRAQSIGIVWEDVAVQPASVDLPVAGCELLEGAGPVVTVEGVREPVGQLYGLGVVAADEWWWDIRSPEVGPRLGTARRGRWRASGTASWCSCGRFQYCLLCASPAHDGADERERPRVGCRRDVVDVPEAGASDGLAVGVSAEPLAAGRVDGASVVVAE
jgi:hypothetical protein